MFKKKKQRDFSLPYLGNYNPDTQNQDLRDAEEIIAKKNMSENARKFFSKDQIKEAKLKHRLKQTEIEKLKERLVANSTDPIMFDPELEKAKDNLNEQLDKIDVIGSAKRDIEKQLKNDVQRAKEEIILQIGHGMEKKSEDSDSKIFKQKQKLKELRKKETSGVKQNHSSEDKKAIILKNAKHKMANELKMIDIFASTRKQPKQKSDVQLAKERMEF